MNRFYCFPYLQPLVTIALLFKVGLREERRMKKERRIKKKKKEREGKETRRPVWLEAGGREKVEIFI